MALSTTCPSCGGVLSRNAMMCPRCGWVVNQLELSRHEGQRQSELQQQRFEEPFRAAGNFAGQYLAQSLKNSNTSPFTIMVSVLLFVGLIVFVIWAGNTPYEANEPESTFVEVSPEPKDDESATPDFIGLDEEFLANLKAQINPVDEMAEPFSDEDLAALVQLGEVDFTQLEWCRIGPYKWISLPSDFYSYYQKNGGEADRTKATVIQKQRNALDSFLASLVEEGWVLVRTEQDEVDEAWEVRPDWFVETRARTELWARSKSGEDGE